jgi:cytochrome c oxidase cbb3-type subunit 3
MSMATHIRATILIPLLLSVSPMPHAGDRPAGKVDGAAIYHSYCSVCHGDAGDGKTSARTALVPPPADFTNLHLRAKLTREYMAAIVRGGKPGTAMVGWGTRLNAAQIDAVVDYVRASFMTGKPATTKRRYHTAENGWPDHDRYAAAFPFARGELRANADDTPLTPEQLRGKRLFMSTCITCHQPR